ncbi:MAG TPA: hypothetical protein VG122_00285 [Gemmata sp.]|nr:hypothetical protein [Gemmata sp.]
MNTQPHTKPALFPNPPQPGFTLWYRPDSNRAAWEAVARVTTEREAVAAIGCGDRRNGRWLVLPNGVEP